MATWALASALCIALLVWTSRGPRAREGRVEATTYYIVGARPVKHLVCSDGYVPVLAMNWRSGVFEYGIQFAHRTGCSVDSDVERVEEPEFIDHVEALRAELYTGDDELGVLYRELRALRDAAAHRYYTDQELERRRQIVTQTYAMFQARFPDDRTTPAQRKPSTCR